jgi:hypothetical protein
MIVMAYDFTQLPTRAPDNGCMDRTSVLQLERFHLAIDSEKAERSQ